ncbi:protein translocase subunit SecF [Nocardioidaceae bacterium SCSIO 66511]|nr:protein translocase subunit SecF [Nocardioidaceae bacterium SCSIO 66511]
MGRISSLGHNLYEGQVSFDFVGRRRLWYAISIVILIVAGLGLFVRGLDMGIEFRGGVEFTAKIAPTSANVDAMRNAVVDSGIADAGDPTVTTSGQSAVRIDTKPLSQDEATKVESALRDAGASDISQNLIGPTWGQQVAKKAAIGLVVFIGFVVIFIWAYFREWKMSVSAIVALIHDLVITVGVYALSGFEVTPATVTGLLTILGYSLYDTVVVFDKVRENTRGFERSLARAYAESANLAVNQTLVRSINTSIMALLPVGSLLVVGVAALGSGPLKDLSLALFVGMAAGTYSSIFIATPLAVQLKESEPVVREQAEKVERRRAREATSGEDEGGDARVGSSTAPTRTVTKSGAAKRAQPSRAPRSRRGRRPK